MCAFELLKRMTEAVTAKRGSEVIQLRYELKKLQEEELHNFEKRGVGTREEPHETGEEVLFSAGEESASKRKRGFFHGEEIPVEEVGQVEEREAQPTRVSALETEVQRLRPGRITAAQRSVAAQQTHGDKDPLRVDPKLILASETDLEETRRQRSSQQFRSRFAQETEQQIHQAEDTDWFENRRAAQQFQIEHRPEDVWYEPRQNLRVDSRAKALQAKAASQRRETPQSKVENGRFQVQMTVKTNKEDRQSFQRYLAQQKTADAIGSERRTLAFIAPEAKAPDCIQGSQLAAAWREQKDALISSLETADQNKRQRAPALQSAAPVEAPQPLTSIQPSTQAAKPPAPANPQASNLPPNGNGAPSPKAAKEKKKWFKK